MYEQCSALLVYAKDEPLGALNLTLRQQSITTCRARTCREAARLLAGPDPPHLVFTDNRLPDGTWEDVLGIAAGASEPVNVIVVGRFLDIQLYFETMERGASDFVIPPFHAPDIDHVVACALEGAKGRRASQANAA
jgi:DNA-binding NtrC family response regulator